MAALAAGAVVVGVGLLGAGTASATPVKAPVTTPGDGNSKALVVHQGDHVVYGYDFTLPGTKSPVTVSWRSLTATFTYACTDGRTGSFSGSLPDGTVSVPDAKWYPTSDPNSLLAYQGAATVPAACSGGPVTLGEISTLSADVTSSPSGREIDYRFHVSAGGRGGGWSSQQTVTTGALPVTPVLDCVAPGSGGGFTGVFGYNNPNPGAVTVPRGTANVAAPKDGAEPTTFESGVRHGVFSVASTGAAVTWTLSGVTVSATAKSAPVCTDPVPLPATGNGTGPVIALVAAGVVGAVLIRRYGRHTPAAPSAA